MTYVNLVNLIILSIGVVLNLTANAARPDPQGSFHYGSLKITRTLMLANSVGTIDGQVRYDYYNIPGVFNLTTIQDSPPGSPLAYGTSVVGINRSDFVEIIFQNNEATLQSYHLDGAIFFVVGYGAVQWTPAMRRKYNLVYPNSWTAVLALLDNKGMWNLRSAIGHRRYLGEDLYLRVWDNQKGVTLECDIPANAPKCGVICRFHFHCRSFCLFFFSVLFHFGALYFPQEKKKGKEKSVTRV
ncbi:hypothetical protein Cgig2_002793 [Carnegiea gigantea]|uniref:Plastocyanin-like domain-containing protein n=1 Tax=Carnegiea gigantea TaxID=171969 RepID=A0A9Q1KPT3_9CARY|nr:hypothetical protein Cgig2_002793 [Carnegiea gigantea]